MKDILNETGEWVIASRCTVVEEHDDGTSDLKTGKGLVRNVPKERIQDASALPSVYICKGCDCSKCVMGDRGEGETTLEALDKLSLDSLVDNPE